MMLESPSKFILFQFGWISGLTNGFAIWTATEGQIGLTVMWTAFMFAFLGLAAREYRRLSKTM